MQWKLWRLPMCLQNQNNSRQFLNFQALECGNILVSNILYNSVIFFVPISTSFESASENCSRKSLCFCSHNSTYAWTENGIFYYKLLEKYRFNKNILVYFSWRFLVSDQRQVFYSQVFENRQYSTEQPYLSMAETERLLNIHQESVVLRKNNPRKLRQLESNCYQQSKLKDLQNLLQTKYKYFLFHFVCITFDFCIHHQSEN